MKREEIVLNGRVVGVIQNGALTKHVQANHYLKDPKAIAFAQEAIDAAERAGVQRVVVTDTDSGTIYSASWGDFMAFSWEFERSGFGKQRAMRLSRWTVNGQAPKPTAQPAPKPEPAQLSLW